MANKELILHIGAPKTGTSAFQAYCAQQAEFMKEHLDLLYPDLSQNHYLASSNKITSGNGLPIARWLNPELQSPGNLRERGRRELDTALKLLNTMPSMKMLISSEDFYHVRPERFDELSQKCKKIGANLHVIGVVRDVLPWISSVYGQQVKQAGEVKSLDEYLRDYQIAFKNIVELIEFTQEHRSFTINLLNYNDVKSDIGPQILSSIVHDYSGELPKSIAKKINRSLDAWETRLMRAANSSLSLVNAHDCRKISDALIYSDPDRKVATPQVSDDVALEVWRKNKDSVEKINRFISGTSIDAGRSNDSTNSALGENDFDVLDALERQTVLLLSALKLEMATHRNEIRNQLGAAPTGSRKTEGTTSRNDHSTQRGVSSSSDNKSAGTMSRTNLHVLPDTLPSKSRRYWAKRWRAVRKGLRLHLERFKR